MRDDFGLKLDHTKPSLQAQRSNPSQYLQHRDGLLRCACNDGVILVQAKLIPL